MEENENSSFALLEYKVHLLGQWREEVKSLIYENERKIEIMENLLNEMQAQKAEDIKLRREDKKWKRQLIFSVVSGVIIIVLAQIILSYIK